MKLGIDKFDDLVECFEKLPGVGKKSAIRYAYFVSLSDSFLGLRLANSIETAVSGLQKCQICGGISENEICEICADETRNGDILCVIESSKDMLVIEQTGSYEGRYFVLEDAKNIDKLTYAIERNGTKEIIFALTPSINSDALMLFLEDKLQNYRLKFSKIAQGVPTGVSLENVDMLSIIKAIKGRMDI